MKNSAPIPIGWTLHDKDAVANCPLLWDEDILLHCLKIACENIGQHSVGEIIRKAFANDYFVGDQNIEETGNTACTLKRTIRNVARHQGRLFTSQLLKGYMLVRLGEIP
jgi:hypothetical protein